MYRVNAFFVCGIKDKWDARMSDRDIANIVDLSNYFITGNCIVRITIDPADFKLSCEIVGTDEVLDLFAGRTILNRGEKNNIL